MKFLCTHKQQQCTNPQAHLARGKIQIQKETHKQKRTHKSILGKHAPIPSEITDNRDKGTEIWTGPDTDSHYIITKMLMLEVL